MTGVPPPFVPPAELTEAFERKIEEFQDAVDTCHERVPCQECGAEVGERCRRKNALTKRGALKHPHVARMRAAGIYPR